MRTETVRGTLSLETKIKVEYVLKKLGLTTSDAINLMLIQIADKTCLPFDISISQSKILNGDTKKELEATDLNKGLIKCKNADDLWDQIAI